MPILSMLDLEQSLKLNQMLIDSNLGNTTNINSLLLKNNATGSLNATVSNNASNAILATAIMQQLQQQQQNLNLNNKFFNNNIILNCIKSNLAANLNSNLNTSLNSTTNSDSSKQINYSRYKTELCRQFNENGECKYGDKCQFAHGMNDLKDVNRHPKYKTDYCKTFHSKGFCPYGPRCHFIHEFYEKNDSNELVKVSGLNCSGSKLKQEKQIKVNVTNINKASLKSPLLNQETSGDYSQILDKQFEAQLTSSLFSTIAEESTPILNENTIASNETKLTAEKSSEKLVDPLDEFNQSQSSFGCTGGSFSPIILSSSSSSSSASVSSATSPTLSASNRMFVKKKLQQLANLSNNSTMYDNDSLAEVFSVSNQSVNEQTKKLSKQLLEAALLNKSINLTSPISLVQQQQNDENDLFTLLNQVKLSSPPSPAPIRTRSSISSTSSSTSSVSYSSSMSSSDYFDRSPVKQQNCNFLNANDLKLYALAHQADPQIDIISIKLNNQKETSMLSNKPNKPRYLGPIGKPLITTPDQTNSFDSSSSLNQQQQLLANLNSLLMSQKNLTLNSDLLYKNSTNRQPAW